MLTRRFLRWSIIHKAYQKNDFNRRNCDRGATTQSLICCPARLVSSFGAAHGHSSAVGGDDAHTMESGLHVEYPIVQLPARSLWCKQHPLDLAGVRCGEFAGMFERVRAARRHYQYPSLCAPQIGWNVQMFTLFDGTVFVNPVNVDAVELEEAAAKDGVSFIEAEARWMERLRREGKTCFAWEPCASCSFLMHYIERPTTVRLRAIAADGQPLEVTLEKMRARMALHELDHLNGVLFTRRVRDTRHVVPLEGFSTMSEWSDDYPSLEARSTFLYTTFTPPYTFITDDVWDAQLLDRKFEDGVYPGCELDRRMRIESAALEELQRTQWRMEKTYKDDESNQRVREAQHQKEKEEYEEEAFDAKCSAKGEGIYPRALSRSKQKQSGNEKQYYLAREIKWLVRDHIAERMMAHRAWEKKVRRAEAMGLTEDLKVLNSDKAKPRYSLVATIKERYPFFMDAVRDIDDAMSLIALYAFLSPEVMSKTTIETHHALTSGLHERAREVNERWNRYVARAHVLSKAFISIKGYYYEAIVRGERVRWLCPHEYAHKFPPGIQQYITLSFLEFYIELMRFVLFKLEHDFERDLAEQQRAEEDELNKNAEDFHVANNNTLQELTGVKKETSSRAELMQEELRKARCVFEGLTFYVSREVPRKHAVLVIEACGGRVTSQYAADGITHFVVDRPALPPGFERVDSIEYVQPQYLFDCLNARMLLPPNGYRLGEELPPHVSPFTVAITNNPEDVAAVEEAKKNHPKIVSYVPKRVHEIRMLVNPQYTPVDPDGKAAELLLQDEGDEEHAAIPELGADDDVSLSGDELAEASRRPRWEEEEVTENVQRSQLSALKVAKQREMNLMNAPTDEVVARRRLAQLKLREQRRQQGSDDERLKRKLADMRRQEKATRKMQLQVARKKAARYYKMVNGVVQGSLKREKILEAKEKQLADGRITKKQDGSGLVNTRKEAKRARAAASGKKMLEKKPANPYKKLPKWVR